uniref:Uncharacterized protein n=1 Tax=Rhizophora mucronata TaxID=61149 RepID=A0A2P2P912_RHIMU
MFVTCCDRLCWRSLCPTPGDAYVMTKICICIIIALKSILKSKHASYPLLILLRYFGIFVAEVWCIVINKRSIV